MAVKVQFLYSPQHNGDVVYLAKTAHLQCAERSASLRDSTKDSVAQWQSVDLLSPWL